MFWLVVAALANMALWTVMPLFVESSLRLDAAEGQIGGPFWLLSYPKHPPFWEWLIALSKLTGPLRYFTVYLIGQTFAVGGFALAAWGMAKENGREAATIAFVLGLASPFTTYVPIQVNPNIILMPFWAITLWTGYWAFERASLKAWIVFGLAVGLGIWAKYSILHLVLPIGLLFLSVPAYRRQLLTPRPWIAALVTIAVVTPHAVSVWLRDGDSLHYAMRTFETSSVEKWGLFGNFLMNVGILQAVMAGIVAVTVGWRPLLASIRRGFSFDQSTRLDWYLHAASFGPVIIVLASPLFDARPRALWVTPFVIGFAIWWGHFAMRAREVFNSHRLAQFGGFWAAVFVATYLLVRLLGPLVGGHASYPELDSRKLTKLAEDAWRTYDSGPIPYIIGIPNQGGRHAIGSIAFDLPYRVAAIEDGSPASAPWVDFNDIKKKGALVVAIGEFPANLQLVDTPVRLVGSFVRPTTRGTTKTRLVSFGIIPRSE